MNRASASHVHGQPRSRPRTTKPGYLWPVLCSVLWSAACGDDGNAPTPDAGLPAFDANISMPDGSSTQPDAALPDAAVPDAAPPVPDAAPPDAAPPDATPPEPPTDITLSNATLSERSERDAVVGTLQAVDPSLDDSHTYELVDDAGGRFRIEGTTLHVADPGLLDYETATTHDIVVRATDTTALSFDKGFTIELEDVGEVCAAADSGPGSLRQAIADAADGSTIYVDACGPIALASPIAVTDKTVAVRGPGAARLTISGDDSTRLLEIVAPGALTLTDVTLADGKSTDKGGCIHSSGILTIERVTVQGCNADGDGGAIHAASPGPGVVGLIVRESILASNASVAHAGAIDSDTVTEIYGSELRNNRAQYSAGALSLNEAATIANSTFAGNRSDTSSGGAIASSSSADGVVLENCTISGNSANFGGGISTSGNTVLRHVTVTGNNAFGLGGGGVIHNSASLTLERSTIAGNTTAFGAPDLSSQSFSDLASNGFNLIGSSQGHPLDDGENNDRVGVNAQLQALADNGGPTRTHALAAGSPAIDIIPAAQCTTTRDQRGQPRPQGNGCDAGAVEQDP